MNNPVNKPAASNGARLEPFRGWVTIPGELMPFVEKQIAQPLHAGKLTNYVRALIVRHQEQELAQ